jgi:hypothetical protein
VGLVLVGAGHASGNLKYLQAGFALMSVFVSWTLVHTVLALRYARLYYSGEAGGIDFNESDAPDYGDFAYLSFTIGMTFQVSDTNIESKQIRRTALRHAWRSFPPGTVTSQRRSTSWPDWPDDRTGQHRRPARAAAIQQQRTARRGEVVAGRLQLALRAGSSSSGPGDPWGQAARGRGHDVIWRDFSLGRRCRRP